MGSLAMARSWKPLMRSSSSVTTCKQDRSSEDVRVGVGCLAMERSRKPLVRSSSSVITCKSSKLGSLIIRNVFFNHKPEELYAHQQQLRDYLCNRQICLSPGKTSLHSKPRILFKPQRAEAVRSYDISFSMLLYTVAALLLAGSKKQEGIHDVTSLNAAADCP